MTSVRPASAIALWSIGAMGVAAIALAGDHTLFRAEPATPARVAWIGLAMLLIIGWPIWSFDRLTRAFVVGQGTIVLVIASESGRESILMVGGWVAACGATIVVAVVTKRSDRPAAIVWTAMLGVFGGAATLGLLREAL